MTKQRLMLISFVGLLVFGLLFGGQALYKENYTEATMLEQVQQIPGVAKVEVSEINGCEQLVVETALVSDLRKMTQEIDGFAGTLPILIKDQRTSDLEQVFNQMQFAIQEGIVRGNFTEMAQSIDEQAAKAGVEAVLTMDGERIYLTLTQDEAQLVAVIERHGQGIYLPSEGK